MPYIMRNGVAYGSAVMPIELIGTLYANTTTVTFTNDAITTDKLYDFYAWDKPNVKPTDAEVNNHTLTLTYPAQATDTQIKVVINGVSNPVQPEVVSVNGKSGGVVLWTDSEVVSCVTGDTSVTIEDTAISATSTLMPFMQSASNKQFAPTTTTITTGQVVYTFPALTEATDFYVKIFN